LGTIAVLEAARANGARRVVNTSTGGGLYGDADVLPTPEDSPIRPLAPYGQSKLCAEGYCALYTRLHGLSTVSLRYGNVYGPRQDVHGEAGVVAIFCGHLIDGRAPTVFGDGGQTRDWVDVADVVAANLLAAQSELTGPINIGHGQETSVLDLLQALREVSPERPLPDPVFAPERPGEVRRSCLDVSRARDELGWEPRVSLRDGLRTILSGL
jgi:UDP-glucose 4-epimerase